MWVNKGAIHTLKINILYHQVHQSNALFQHPQI